MRFDFISSHSVFTRFLANIIRNLKSGQHMAEAEPAAHEGGHKLPASQEQSYDGVGPQKRNGFKHY